MGKLIFGMQASLDGYVADAAGTIPFERDEALFRFINAEDHSVRTCLYGRRMYETMVYWETAEGEPGQPEFALDWAYHWKSQQKLVFSTTLDSVIGKSRILRSLDDLDLAAVLAHGDATVSGPNLGAQFLARGLIDEIQVYLMPRLLGGGTPLFAAVQADLELIENRAFPSGTVFNRYRPHRPPAD